MINKILTIFTISITIILISSCISTEKINSHENFGISNSKFGSRFNIYTNFNTKQTFIGTMGMDFDNENNIKIILKDNKQIQLFPLNDNINYEIDIGLTYQKIVYDLNDMKISFSIISPFYPTKTFDEEIIKINTAPFLYGIIEIFNPKSKKQSGKILISLDKVIASKNIDLKYPTLYFKDSLNPKFIKSNKKQNSTLILSLLNKDSTFTEKGISINFNIEPSKTKKIIFVLAGYNQNNVIEDLKSNGNYKFYYTKHFGNIEEIVRYAFENYDFIINKTNEFEDKLTKSNLDKKTKWVIAQSFHSYISNTWLVYNSKYNITKFFVWEGCCDCCYWINTVDVAHEYGVFEGLEIPWALRLQLEEWASNIKEDEYGTFIQHDLGKALKIVNKSFYYVQMPVEENSNYILLLYWYWKKTGDDNFILNKISLIKSLVKSLINRDKNKNGIADVGVGWTTYDGITEALRSSPDNTYLGVKEMAAYIAASEIFDYFNINNEEIEAKKQAEIIKNSIKEAYEEYGYIPISLDRSFVDWDSYSTIIAEGLFYLALTNTSSEIIDELIPVFSDNYNKSYNKCKREFGINLVCKDLINYNYNKFPNIWQIYPDVSWLSKMMVEDLISNRLFTYKTDSFNYAFDRLINNPRGYSDAYLTTVNQSGWLNFYPRGVVSYALLFT